MLRWSSGILASRRVEMGLQMRAFPDRFGPCPQANLHGNFRGGIQLFLETDIMGQGPGRQTITKQYFLVVDYGYLHELKLLGTRGNFPVEGFQGLGSGSGLKAKGLQNPDSFCAW